MLDAGEMVRVVLAQPQPRSGVGLRADGAAELGGHELAEVLLIGAAADVLLHRLHHPPIHGWGARHRFVSYKLAQRGGGDARRRRRRRR